MTGAPGGVVIDCADPHAQAAFWAAALGYVVEDSRVLIERLLSAGAIRNRLHLDLLAGWDHRDGEVARLRELGATVLQEIKEPGTEHVVMADPEGNEFCVQ